MTCQQLGWHCWRKLSDQLNRCQACGRIERRPIERRPD